MSADREEHRRAVGSQQEALAQVQELKTLVAHMDASSRAQGERVSRLNQALSEGDEGAKRLETEVGQLFAISEATSQQFFSIFSF